MSLGVQYDMIKHWTFVYMLGTHFAWILSLPLWGPILSYTAENSNGFDPYPFGFWFITASTISFVVIPFIQRISTIVKCTRLCGLTLVLTNILYFFLPLSTWVVAPIVAGYCSAALISSWFIRLSTHVRSEERGFVVAGSIVLANVILYMLTLLLPFLNSTVLFALLVLLTTSTLLFLPSCEDISYQNQTQNKHTKPAFYSALLFILLFYWASGSIVDIVYAALAEYTTSFQNYSVLVYILVVIFLSKTTNIAKPLPFVGSTVLMGISLMSYLMATNNGISLVVSSIIAMSAFGIMDLYLWSYLVQQDRPVRQALGLFNLGLATNLAAIFGSTYLGGLFSRTGSLGVETGSALLFFSLIPLFYFVHLSLKEPNLSSPNPIQAQDQLSTDASEHLNTLFVNLTPRETDVLKLVIAGYSNQQIVDDLQITMATTRTHLRNIYRKTGFPNRSKLLASVVQNTLDSYETTRQ